MNRQIGKMVVVFWMGGNFSTGMENVLHHPEIAGGGALQMVVASVVVAILVYRARTERVR